MAWTISVNKEGPYRWANGQQLWLFKYNLTSDASPSGDIVLSTQLETTYGVNKAYTTMKYFRGSMLQSVVYIPDGSDTPTTAPQITIDQEDGVKFFDETVAAAGTGEVFAGSVDTNHGLPFTELTLASTTLADTKKAVYKLWVIR